MELDHNSVSCLGSPGDNLMLSPEDVLCTHPGVRKTTDVIKSDGLTPS